MAWFEITGLYTRPRVHKIEAFDIDAACRQFHDQFPGLDGTILAVKELEPEAESAE